MFSLGDGAKFWLYTKPTDMRKNFNMLSGIVSNDMRQNLYSGDVFVFVNASNNMMKLLRHEPGGLVIYNKRLDHGRMHLVERIQEGDPTMSTSILTWTTRRTIRRWLPKSPTAWRWFPVRCISAGSSATSSFSRVIFRWRTRTGKPSG